MLLMMLRETLANGTRTIMSVNTGLKIETMGKVAQGKEETLISVFLKLPSYENLLDPELKMKSYMKANTFCESVQKTLTTPLKHIYWNISHWSEIRGYGNLLKSYNNTLHRFIKSRISMLHTYQTPMNNVDKHLRKRSVLSFLGGALFSAITLGITEYQIHKINSHLSEFREDISKLASGILHQQEEIVALNNRVFGLVKKSTYLITDEIHKLRCNDFYKHFVESWKLNFDEYKRLVDDTLWTALSGSNSLKLTPHMIDPETLHYIVDLMGESLTNDSLYRKEPNLLYSVATVNLVGINSNLTVGHFILRFPSLATSRIYDLFEVSQVGLHLGAGICSYFKIPDFVFEAKGTLHHVQMSNCLKHNRLYICPLGSFPNSTSCVQPNSISCQPLNSRCKGDFEFALSQAGILIRNNIALDTFVTNTEGFTHLAQLSNLNVIYLDWAQAKSVQFGGMKIPSPSAFSAPLSPVNYSVELPYSNQFIDSENITEVFGEICNQYNKSLGTVLKPLKDYWETQASEFIPHSSIGVIIPILSGILFISLLWSTALTLAIFKLHKKLTGPVRIYEKIPIASKKAFNVGLTKSSSF